MYLIKNFGSKICLLVAISIAFLTSDVAAAAKKEWITLENCQLILNKDNDGDSFHIKANGKEYVVRLYLVDAPEIKGLMAARLIEQAQAFGISVPQVIEIGEKAKQFADSKLSEPFTVTTRLAGGMGRGDIGRVYGFVQAKDGDLGQLLVGNGFARVHGTRAPRPGAKSAGEEIERLQQLEREAKQAKLGGWGLNVGAAASTPQPMRTVTVQQPSQTPSTPALARATAPRPIGTLSARPSTSATADTGKLDINTATKEQLEKIPGIGEALSERIIAARPFRSADELKKVKGLGEGKRYEQVRSYFQ